MKHMILYLLAGILFIGCSPTTALNHHNLQYEVKPSHPDKEIQNYLDQQNFGFEVSFESDSFLASYDLGASSLKHVGLGKDSALLAATFTHGDFLAGLGKNEIAHYLKLRNPFTINEQPGNEMLDSLKCKKALLIYPDGKTGEVWYTKKYEAENKLYEYGFHQLAGLPIKFIVKEEDIAYTFRLVAISKRAPSKKISIDTDNYKIVRLAELLNRGIKP